MRNSTDRHIKLLNIVYERSEAYKTQSKEDLGSSVKTFTQDTKKYPQAFLMKQSNQRVVSAEFYAFHFDDVVWQQLSKFSSSSAGRQQLTKAPCSVKSQYGTYFTRESCPFPRWQGDSFSVPESPEHGRLVQLPALPDSTNQKPVAQAAAQPIHRCRTSHGWLLQNRPVNRQPSVSRRSSHDWPTICWSYGDGGR